jgi:bifunctional non-homologous end joining protein LigD
LRLAIPCQRGEEALISEVDGKLIKLTNLDKPMWQEPLVTKGDLIHYYYQVAPLLIPHLKNRPLTVTRYPDGIDGAHFYQKQCPPHAPPWIKTYSSSAKDKVVDYILANDRATLVWLANQGTIELHPWLSTVDSPDYPDLIVVDLDPDPPAGWPQVIEVARLVKGLLDEMGLASFPKTSGATGLHVYIPVAPRYSYRVTSRFVGFLGKLIAAHHPQLATNERLIKRRRGRVYIDHLQNLPGKTIVAPYSLRPRSWPTISMPFPWEDLNQIDPKDFTINSPIPERDPLADMLGLDQDIDGFVPLFKED